MPAVAGAAGPGRPPGDEPFNKLTSNGSKYRPLYSMEPMLTAFHIHVIDITMCNQYNYW